IVFMGLLGEWRTRRTYDRAGTPGQCCSSRRRTGPDHDHRHGCRVRSASYPEGVSSDDVGVDAGTGTGAGARHPDLDRTAGAAGVVTYVTAGLLPLLTGSAMPALWWALWVGGLPVFVALVLLPLGRTAAIALLGAGAVIAAGLFVANPLFGFGAVPMVLVAAIAGLVLQ